MTRSDAEFLQHIKTKSGMPDAKERQRLRQILEKMKLQSTLNWVEPEKGKSQ